MATIIARPWHVANRARADGCLYPSLRTPDVAANRLFEACFCALTGNCRNDLLIHGIAMHFREADRSKPAESLFSDEMFKKFPVIASWAATRYQPVDYPVSG